MPDVPDTVLFDGDCAYCNGWVKWIAARDKAHRFRFAPLGSEEGRTLRERHHVPPGTDSIVLIQDGQAFLRSDAAWRVLRGLPGKGLLGGLLRIIPRPLRNWGYDLVARNRHRFGMKDACELPQR
ncbi:MAG TPA: DCC1-like thiol-disulfide oxidoreductase family protein [Flavobacteriales bacterium]|jgi:predicted DCC family thiol-disulfide oxidoreductase YuxK|nr:DCC1-like thiol-disulfide oxidoreductase family protein [Flavobacteriales bacterium]